MRELEAPCNREVLSACSPRGERLAGCGADRGDFCDPAMGCTFRGKKEEAGSYLGSEVSSRGARSKKILSLVLRQRNGAVRRGAGGYDRGEQDIELERRMNAQGQAQTALRASYALQSWVDSAARAIHRGPKHSSHRPACV